MWTRRGHPSTTADMVLSWGEILYRASVMLAGLIIVLAAINGLYQISILEEPIIPVVPFVIAAAIWLVGFFCRKMSA
jgi:purine-cytosine permease-like protein